MKTIESILEPITGYLFSITRNTLHGWYDLEIGIPKGWVFNENKEIKCEVLDENDNGKLIKISPKKHDVVVDDLVAFVELIIETNKRITEKEKEFSDKMADMKKNLEEEAKQFYKELEELKENSFKNLNDRFEKTIGEEKKEIRRGRKPKITQENPDNSESTDNTTKPAEE